MTIIFARLAAERGALGDELAERKGVDLPYPPLDPAEAGDSPPVLPNPILDRLLWYRPQRQLAMDLTDLLYAEQLYPGA